MLGNIKKNIDLTLKSFTGQVKKTLQLNKISPQLYSNLEEFILRKGKRIRPIIFILSYCGYKKRIPKNNNLFESALSVELLHDFLLIHDDIIDKSELRRGKPTLHRLLNSSFKTKNESLGSSLAIVIGDIVFSLAIKALLKIKEKWEHKETALRQLSHTTTLTAAGEFVDIVDSTKKIEDITEKDIFLNYTLKTARYTFECPLLMGAELAGAAKKDIKMLSKFGIYVGQAFQIQDDLLGIFGTEKSIGKSILTDIKESKKTLLVWRAYNNTNTRNKLLLKRILESSQNDYRDLLKIRRIIKESGAYGYCIKKIKDLLNMAYLASSNLTINKKYRNLITDFLNQQFSPSLK